MGQEERFFDPRRDTENCNCNTFCPRRATEGPRRTATATPFVHEGPRRDTENCNCNTFVHEEPRRDHGELQNCNTFCPRRATEGHGELQLQHLLSTKGHGGHGELQNCNTFCPRRATEGHGELQLQHLLSTKSHGGTRRTATATPFVHEGPRRDTENCNCNTFCPRRATEGHGELQLQHLLSTKGRRDTENCNCNTFCPRRDAEGHGERTATPFVRRTATATPFVHEGTRRDGENGDCNTLCPRRDAGDHEENLFLSAVGCEEQLFDPRGAVKERARCLRS